MIKNFTSYFIAALVSILIGFLAGIQVQKSIVEDECSKLGGFYFGNNVYQCVATK